MLDIERIINTDIPDIAPVYGGVRGRTISSQKQAYAWKSLVEAGLRQVIDLRKDYSADRYPELCRKYGVDYFHYPIDNDHETIAKMVEMFPTFCKKIDKGDFYIACAMGLHRTDIALCTYWVFYAADKGIAPHPLKVTDRRMVTTPTRLCVCSMPSISIRQKWMAKNPCPLKCSRNVRK